MNQIASQHPEIIVSISTAIISSTVAIVVVILTHWNNSKRERIDHLIKKLEELYLLLNGAGEDNLDRFNIIKIGLINPSDAISRLLKLDDIYCIKLHKKIQMYIRLYFPQLEQTHKQLFQRQHILNDLSTEFINSTVLSFQKVDEATTNVGGYLEKMQKEIIKNQAILVGKRKYFVKYKRAT